MQLKRLIIQGFKSFKDRTTINFDDGITGIVGPNGCGKSNIVDALFWVMGEQSAKHLRGNSMKDLIFAGSSKYSPGAFAEATLVLENTDLKHIHIGSKVANPSEIQLTRKLYRNGDTEYRINGEPARLKDIHEVFMDTGAGAKSYSIIAQGEINRLVQAKPVERRTMIEEVAGVTKFKVRKKESLKKIDQTQTNLNRLNDLTIEIEKNLKSLQKQAEKAEKARSLRDKVKRNEVSYNAHKVFDALKELRDGSVEVNENRLKFENLSIEKDNIEVSLEEERYLRDEKSENIENLQRERNEVSNKLAKAEERLNSLCSSLSDKEKQSEQREKDIEELRSEREERALRLNELNDELESVVEESKKDFDYEGEEEAIATFKEELSLKEEALSELRDEIDEMKERSTKMEQTAFQNNSKLEEYSTLLQDLAVEIEALEKQYSGVSTELAKERDAVNDANELVEELSTKEASLKEVVTELYSKNQELNKEHNQKYKDLISTQSRLGSLKEIAASLEGAKEGISDFLSANETDAYSVLGTLVKCDEKYTKAVNALIGEFFETLITSESDLSLMESWLTSNSESAFEILIGDKQADVVSEEALERLKLKFGESLISLTDIVEIDEKYKSKLTPYLSGLFIVDSLDVNQLKSISTGINFVGITDVEGRAVLKNRNKALVYTQKSDDDGAQSAVERNNLIEELAVKSEELEKEVSELEQDLDQRTLEYNDKKEELELLRNSLSDSKADYAAKKSALDSKLAGMESGNTRLEILQNRKNETSKLRLEILEREEDFTKERNELLESLDDKQSLFIERTEEYSTEKENYEQRREVLMEKQVEAKTFEQRVDSLKSQISDMENQIEKQATRIENNEELVQKLSEEMESVQADINTLEDENNETADILKERDEILSHLKDEFAELLIGMQEREERVRELSKETSQLEREINEREVKLERALEEEEDVVRNIFEKYQIDLRDSLGRFLEYETQDYERLKDLNTMYFMETENGVKEIDKASYDFVRKYGQDLKELGPKLKGYKTELARLGEINWQAIEDYDRQKLRYDFLKIQEEELKKSLEDLQAAITHIDEKSKERFKVAFEEVNVRFQKVFPIIFGGGNATLKIVGNIDDPECGVDIIAQPPGKKMQNINLMSGGEKAMTAVSLIFSIFLVKPSPFCLLDEVDAPLDDANVGRFNELLREMSAESQFILITHNKKTMELNDMLYGVTMQEPGVSKAVSVQLH